MASQSRSATRTLCTARKMGRRFFIDTCAFFERAEAGLTAPLLSHHSQQCTRHAVAAVDDPRGPGLRPGSGGGVNVDLRFGGNDFTYRKLFHLLIGNCFITCHLLIETTIGRVPKFVSIGYFCGHLVTLDLLIELYPMVPFSSVVRQRCSVPPFPMYVLTTPTLLSAQWLASVCRMCRPRAIARSTSHSASGAAHIVRGRS